MRRKFFIAALLLTILLIQGLSEALGRQSQTVTVWLIPLEPADENTQADIDIFDRSVSRDGPVTVLNTRCRIYRDQLKNWNPEFDYPNFPIVKGQRQTIKALARFAKQNDVRINVRFVWWGQAFEELQKIRAAGGDETCEDIEGGQLQVTPDVAQIGTTWVAYFAKRHALLPLDGLPAELKFYSTPDMPRAALRYATDLRLIFYWKRMSSPADPPLKIDGSSWDSILKSLEKVSVESGNQSPPMAIPIAAGPNLLHDYVPLVRSGGGSFLNARMDYVDLTSDAALAVPRLLAARATLTDEKSRWHRLVAFPEITHEEAVHHFWDGEYFAVIEPAGFIKRWRDKWLADLKENKTPLPQRFVSQQSESPAGTPLKFWDYAGVAVPPSTFIGGSVLSLMNRGVTPPAPAKNLISFLAADEEYTAMLAELGNLPAQRPDYGLNLFTAPLGDEQKPSAETAVSPGLVDFGVALGLALEKREELEHPPLEEWPTVLESQDVLESFQRIWRRIGEGNVAQVEEAAAATELAINKHINFRTRLVESVRNQWQLITGGLLLIMAGLLAFSYRELKHSRKEMRGEQERAGALKERAEALIQVRKVRGFASSALTIVDTVHYTLRFNPFLVDAGEKQALKARIISAGLQGWSRGQDDRLWEPEKLESVIWRAILLAVESARGPDLFKRWEDCGCHPETFLRRERILRDDPEVRSGCPPFYFGVPDTMGEEVQLPFMFEQALVCLLQNAIIASWDIKHGYASAISIELDADSKTIAVANSGAAIDRTLCDALNKNLEVAEFRQEVDKLLRGPVRHRPGIGLVEAYCIARQCYGGLKVDTGGPRVSIKYCAD
jgi:ABC-type glycerol-3-phosphate transport system substrate-binding protein